MMLFSRLLPGLTALAAAVALACWPASRQAVAGTRPAGTAARPAAAWVALGRLSPRELATARMAAGAAAPLVSDSTTWRWGKAGLPAPPMTAAMEAANAAKQAQASGFLATMAAAGRPLPRERNLALTQQPQTRDYYCGPATVSEMLAQLGVRLTQRAAARSLRTSQGGTDWSDARGYPVPKLLNSEQDRNNYVAVALPWSPTRKQIRTYETDLVADINHRGGVPLAGDAYEVPGGPHLVGHPAYATIFHWFDIRGYRHSGAITDYEDSVHGATSIGWSGSVPAYSALPSATIVYILGARGYDW
jgi:hypothetical protein